MRRAGVVDLLQKVPQRGSAREKLPLHACACGVQVGRAAPTPKPQSRCLSNTDRGATTENPDPQGRSVGAPAAQAALVARRRRRFSMGNGHFERKSVKKSPAARIMGMSDDRVFAASFRDEVAADPKTTSYDLDVRYMSTSCLRAAVAGLGLGRRVGRSVGTGPTDRPRFRAHS